MDREEKEHFFSESTKKALVIELIFAQTIQGR